MSRSTALAALSRIAAGLALAPFSACHQQSLVPGHPSSPDSDSVGYAQQPRGRTEGSGQSVTADELKNLSVRRVEELLAGRFAGVRVLPTPNGGFSIRVRTSAALDDRDPLYVVDGMAVDVTPGRGLDSLNPADIERIEVLRNPAETGMYGSRGANGVILITTKKSSRKP